MFYGCTSLLKILTILDNFLPSATNETCHLTMKLFPKIFKCFFFCSLECCAEMFIQLKNQSLVAFFGLFSRLENVQYPYQLYIAPSTSSTERPSPNGPDRPFQCPTCGVRFTRIQNLKQHMLIHSGNVASPTGA